MSHKGFIKGLRLLADHLEAHPDFPELAWPPDFYFHVTSKDALVAAAKTLGTFTKRTSGTDFFIDKKFGGIEIKLYTARANVCTKVVTGEVWKEGRVAQPATEGKMVETVRWDCPDMLLTKE